MILLHVNLSSLLLTLVKMLGSVGGLYYLCLYLTCRRGSDSKVIASLCPRLKTVCLILYSVILI